VLWANRNGFYYVLDRATGEFLTGVPFVEQNWAKGLDAKGRPQLVDSQGASDRGRLVRPGVVGGTNWQNPAYDEKRDLVFIPATEGAAVFTKSEKPKRGNRGTFLGSAGAEHESTKSVVRALDPATGAQRWEYFSPHVEGDPLNYSGLLATEGGLVLGSSGGYLFALDSTTGQEKWRVYLGSGTHAAPITFTMDGRQVVVVSSGRAVFMFGLGGDDADETAQDRASDVRP
jgi:alcohol dehydrogenase (cytochrome c)